MQKTEVRYLFNSGFAVKTGGRIFIFDYYNPRVIGKAGSLDAGVVSAEALTGCEVTVFGSHAHRDHYTPDILKWERKNPDIQYVLSYDIAAPKKPAYLTTAYPNEVYELDDIKIRTLKSTDAGVAFIVETPALKLYHAGDNNWWHWAGEPDGENEAMGAAYRNEIDKLRGEAFDIAFVPVDPRLGAEYLWGLDYFMCQTHTNIVFPMHFGHKYSIFDRLEENTATKKYRSRIMRITRRGEMFAL